jgi:hypothetical protein
VVGVAMSVDGPDELHAELLAQGCRRDMCIRPGMFVVAQIKQRGDGSGKLK